MKFIVRYGTKYWHLSADKGPSWGKRKGCFEFESIEAAEELTRKLINPHTPITLEATKD